MTALRTAQFEKNVPFLNLFFFFLFKHRYQIEQQAPPPSPRPPTLGLKTRCEKRPLKLLEKPLEKEIV